MTEFIIVIVKCNDITVVQKKITIVIKKINDNNNSILQVTHFFPILNKYMVNNF